MKNNILKIVFVIIGTMIGAGFASGQEIYLFFFSFGLKGLIGIVISSILTYFVIYKTLKLIKNNQIETYSDFLDLFIKNKFIKKVLNISVNIFILITFFIMIAGFGAYFEQQFGINSIWGSIILATLSFIIFMTNVKGVIKVNEFLVPILVIFLIIIGIVNIKNLHLLELNNYITKTNNSSFVLSAIIYGSYNSILLIPVLLTLKKYINSDKQIIKITLISSFILFLLSIIIYLILVRVDVDITKLEMPAVYVVSNGFKIFKYIYGFIILGSIFTTAISLGTSFLQNICETKKSYPHLALLLCITSILISNFGFSNLVNYLYPIFGYLGILQILKLIL